MTETHDRSLLQIDLIGIFLYQWSFVANHFM